MSYCVSNLTIPSQSIRFYACDVTPAYSYQRCAGSIKTCVVDHVVGSDKNGMTKITNEKVHETKYERMIFLTIEW